jgi:hypothetical protein
MADDATARRPGPSSAQRRIGASHQPGGPAKPPQAARRRRRGGAWRVDRTSLWRRLWALQGGVEGALRRIGGRVLAPRRGRAVRLVLPAIETAADIAAMLAAITAAVRRGVITPAEAASLAEVADVYVRALETSEFDRRLRALETAHAAAS